MLTEISIDSDNKIILPSLDKSLYSYMSEFVRILQSQDDYDISSSDSSYYKLLNVFADLATTEIYSLSVFFLLMYNICNLNASDPTSKNESAQSRFIKDLISYLESTSFNVGNIYQFMTDVVGTKKTFAAILLQNQLLTQQIELSPSKKGYLTALVNGLIDSGIIGAQLYVDVDNETKNNKIWSYGPSKVTESYVTELNESYVFRPKISYFSDGMTIPRNYLEYREKLHDLIINFRDSKFTDDKKSMLDVPLYANVFSPKNIFAYLIGTNDIIPINIAYEFNVKKNKRNTIITQDEFYLEFDIFLDFIAGQKEQYDAFVDIDDLSYTNGIDYLTQYYETVVKPNKWKLYKSAIFVYIMMIEIYKTEQNNVSNDIVNDVQDSIIFYDLYRDLYTKITTELGDTYDTKYKVK